MRGLGGGERIHRLQGLALNGFVHGQGCCLRKGGGTSSVIERGFFLGLGKKNVLGNKEDLRTEGGVLLDFLLFRVRLKASLLFSCLPQRRWTVSSRKWVLR